MSKPTRKELVIISPNNVALRITLANLGERIAAYVLDFLLVGSYLTLVSVVFIELNSAEIYAPDYVVFLTYVPTFLYRPVCESILQGQTIGKRVKKLKVIQKDGLQAGPLEFATRWMLLPVDFFFTGGPGLISFNLTSFNQRLGDIAANTVVIKLPEAKKEQTKIHIKDLGEEPFFFEAQTLSEEDIELIEDVIIRYKASGDRTLIISADAAFKQKLRLQDTDLEGLTFLYQLLKDHHLYAKEKEASSYSLT